jgi:hypothetical protein
LGSLIGITLCHRALDSAQQFDGLALIFQGGALGGDTAQVDNTRHQRRKQGVGHGIAAAAYEHVEEPVGCPHVSDHIKTLNGLVHIIDGRFQRRHIRVGGTRNAEARHAGFQRCPYFVNLPRLVR